jgi:hypothetical protein
MTGLERSRIRITATKPHMDHWNEIVYGSLERSRIQITGMKSHTDHWYEVASRSPRRSPTPLGDHGDLAYIHDVDRDISIHIYICIHTNRYSRSMRPTDTVYTSRDCSVRLDILKEVLRVARSLSREQSDDQSSSSSLPEYDHSDHVSSRMYVYRDDGKTFMSLALVRDDSSLRLALWPLDLC